MERFWCQVLWHLWIGPRLEHVAVEVFHVGGWLTHGDLASEALVDFLAVVEQSPESSHGS